MRRFGQSFVENGGKAESYLKELARKSGIEEPSRADIAKLDKKRPMKPSNKEWVNSNEPDRSDMKIEERGRTDMAHKAEHAVDMSGEGAVIAVTLHGVPKGDTKSLPDTLEKAQSNPCKRYGRTTRNIVNEYRRCCTARSKSLTSLCRS